MRGPRYGPRTPPDGGLPFTSLGSPDAGAQIWPPHSPRWRTTVYFLRLSRCGGPDMAPALPQAADYRLLLQALQMRGPRYGPRTPPGRGLPFTSSSSPDAGAQIWPPHSPRPRTLVSALALG